MKCLNWVVSYESQLTLFQRILWNDMEGKNTKLIL